MTDTMAYLSIDGSSHEAYANIQEADDYLNIDPIRETAWEALTTDERKKKLVAASRTLDKLRWQGSKVGQARNVYTATANFNNDEEIVIGTRTYTMRTSLANVDGYVLIGTTLADSLANLIAAVGLGTGAGTVYADATTENPHGYLLANGDSRVVLVSKVHGTAGNGIVCTTDAIAGSWENSSTTGGDDPNNQIRQWPRTGVTYKDGSEIGETVIPIQIKEATILLAGDIALNAANAASGTSGSNIKAVGAGSARVEYFRPTDGAPVKNPDVWALINCWIGGSTFFAGFSNGGSACDSSFNDANYPDKVEGYP